MRIPNSAGSAPVTNDDAADQVGVQNTAEAGDAVGQHNAVDTVLNIGVIVADVQQAAGRRIL